VSTTSPIAITEQQKDTLETILFNSRNNNATEETAQLEISGSSAYQTDTLQKVENGPSGDGAKHTSMRREIEARPNATALVGLSGQKGGYLIGVSKSYAFMTRLSLVYGLGLNHYVANPGSLESGTGPVLKTDLQIPLMLRYYFTPPENKFQGFVYGGLLNSWALNQSGREQSYRINFKSGLEEDNKYFQSKNGKSAAYFHLRVPIFQKNINNSDPFPALYNLLPKR